MSKIRSRSSDTNQQCWRRGPSPCQVLRGGHRRDLRQSLCPWCQPSGCDPAWRTLRALHGASISTKPSPALGVTWPPRDPFPVPSAGAGPTASSPLSWGPGAPPPPQASLTLGDPAPRYRHSWGCSAPPRARGRGGWRCGARPGWQGRGGHRAPGRPRPPWSSGKRWPGPGWLRSHPRGPWETQRPEHSVHAVNFLENTAHLPCPTANLSWVTYAVPRV